MNQEFTEEKNSSSEKATITIPSVSISLPRISTTGVLMFFLIIASFFLGSFVAKQQIKQDEKSGIIQANNQVIPQPLPSIGVIGTQQQVGQAVVPGKKVEVDSGHLEIKGDKNAKVTVVEFADFRCPFCERFFTDVEPQLIKDYVNTGKVKLAYRHFAFLGPASVVAANASECANEQNKFWDMHDYLFENQPSESDTSLYTTDKLTSIAGSLGMSTAQFKSCMNSSKYDKNVSDDLTAGQKVGVQGTPTVFVNGVPIIGAQPYSAFKAEIDKALSQ